MKANYFIAAALLMTSISSCQKNNTATETDLDLSGVKRVLGDTTAEDSTQTKQHSNSFSSAYANLEAQLNAIDARTQAE